MIIILCDSYQEAKDGYDIFMDYLEYHEPWEVRKTYDHCQCVETWDDFRYIFVYYRCVDIFSEKDGRFKRWFQKEPDIMSLDEFLENLPGFYDE